MSDDRYGEGLDFLGCDELGQVAAQPIAPNVIIKPIVVTPSPLPAVKDWLKDKKDKTKAKVDNLPVALGVGGGAGALVGGGLGAWLMGAHRLLGGLGGLVAGAGVGMAAGYGVMKVTAKGTTKIKDAKKVGAK